MRRQRVAARVTRPFCSVGTVGERRSAAGCDSACGTSTRSGVPRYNELVPPFQTLTKAGNVNASLDHIASADIHFDFFVQLDVDRRPCRAYLERTLGYLDDARVGWAQAPSVYADLDDWTARGLAEQDLLFHGPLHMGFYGHSPTAFHHRLAHTAYRMAAVRETGAFQPSRAEDHLDTIVLAAGRYTGVYVPRSSPAGMERRTSAPTFAQQFAGRIRSELPAPSRPGWETRWGVAVTLGGVQDRANLGGVGPAGS
jgi:hypothetical protein